MPTALTHLGFLNNLRKENPAIFKKVNLNYLESGAIFPDYYGFFHVQLKLKPLFFKEIQDQKGVIFGKRMLSVSKTKEEKSFAIGFISHCILDKYFHTYFKKHKITSIEEHLMLEFFYDCKFKNQKINPVIYPIGLMEKTLQKYYKKINYKKTYITKFKLLGYYLFLKEIQNQIIYKKYLEHKISYLDILAIPFYRKPISLKKLITPNQTLKDKHLKNLEKEYKKAEKEMNLVLV